MILLPLFEIRSHFWLQVVTHLLKNLKTPEIYTVRKSDFEWIFECNRAACLNSYRF